MRKLLLLLFFVFIQVGFADYYVPINTTVKMYVPIYNNQSQRLIIYSVYPPKQCYFNSTILPIVVKPFQKYNLKLICKFKKGKYNLTLKILEINGNNYPETNIYLNVVAQKSLFYVFVNDGIIPSKSKFLYHINVGDIVRIIYFNNSIPYQYTKHLKIIYVGNYNNSTYYIYARAISPGTDSIYLNNLTSILFNISVTQKITNYLESTQLVYLVYNISNHTNLLFNQIMENLSSFIKDNKKFRTELQSTITTSLLNVQKNQKQTNQNLKNMNEYLKNISNMLNYTILELKNKDKNILQLKLELSNKTNQYNQLLQKYNQLAYNVNSIVEKNAEYTVLIYILSSIIIILLVLILVVYIYFVKKVIPRYQNRIRKLNETIQELERNPFNPPDRGGRR